MEERKRGRPRVDKPKKLYTFRLSEAELSAVRKILKEMRKKWKIQ